MRKKTEENKDYISRLKKCVESSYGIVVTSLSPAKRGFYGKTG